jgi:hypothetical protein
VKRSTYAAKQGRSSSTGGRTRVAPTSPFSTEYRVNPSHRLAEYHAIGEALARAAARPRDRFDPRGFDWNGPKPQRSRPARW